MRLGASGHVDLVDELVVGEPCADVAPSVRDANESPLDERRKCLLQERPHVFVDRVHLEDAHLTLVDELVEHVERRDRGDVAGAEHERDFRLVSRLAVERGDVLVEVLGCDVGLHPNFGADTAQEQPVVDRRREHVDDDLPVLGSPHGTLSNADPAVLFDLTERLDVPIQPIEQRPGSRRPLLARERGAFRDSLRAHRGLDPCRRRARRLAFHSFEKLGFLADGKLGPCLLFLGERSQIAFERGVRRRASGYGLRDDDRHGGLRFPPHCRLSRRLT